MWFLLIYSQILTVQGLDRVVLRGSNSPCTGRLEVYRNQERQWGLVHFHGWNRINGEVVCKSLGCGALVHTDVEMTLYKDPPPPERYLMDQVKCSSKEESLWNCPYVGINKERKKEQRYVAVECAGNVTLSLNMNGQTDKCAGVVQFSTQNGDISVCNSDWDQEKANKICQELNCGEHYYIPKSGIFGEQQSKPKGLLKCVGNERFSWQCMEWPVNCVHDASVICTKHRRFRLQEGSNLCSGFVDEYDVQKKSWLRLQQTDVTPETICAQLDCGTSGNFANQTKSLYLTCSGNVTLLNFTSVCFGPVHVVVDGSERGVCYGNTMSREMGMVVCRELRCGDVLNVKQGKKITNGLLSNVECDGDEASLWHCLAKHRDTECHVTEVTCAGGLDVRLRDGFGRCSGRVEVNLEGSWRSFGSSDWTVLNSDVVCNLLGCGDSNKMTRNLFPEDKRVELDWVIKCESSSAKLHECLQKPGKNTPAFQGTAQIICQKEELVFLKGDRPCQGRVGIESFDGQKRWLDAELVSQNNKTASDVCEAMQCGSLTSFERDQNTTYANVKCSGSVNVTLSNLSEDRCWGTVIVSRGDGYGGVCEKTWTPEESRMICEDLDCGDPIKSQLISKTQVKHYSVYCPTEVKNLRMCNFIPNKDFICKDPASVICTKSVKVKLEDPRDRCAGKVLLSYAGEWTAVCENSLDKNLQNAICKELKCGEAESSAGTLDGQSQTQGLSGIKCSSDADSLVGCILTGMAKKRCTAGYLKCSGRTRLFLYKMEGACSGPVSVLSSGRTPQLVSIQGWTGEEGRLLCRYLQCGNYISHSGISILETSEWWNKTYNCSGQNNIWDCERDGQSVQPQQLNIRCDGEPPEITLSNPCAGQVLVNKMPACASEWDERMSQVLCNNLRCGNALDYWQSRVDWSEGWRFSCGGPETSLWQCSSMRAKCDNIINVACQNSVKLRTSQTCGGYLMVEHLDQWGYVSGDMSETYVKNICEALGCKNNQTRLISAETYIQNNKLVSINCSGPYQSLSQCVQILKYNEQNEYHNAVMISCEGYEENNPVKIILIFGLTLGILGLLVLIIVSQRRRLRSALRRYRNRDIKDLTLNGNELNNMETVDSDSSERKLSLFDDYEDVDAAVTNNKREDDAGSAGTEYDDIEEEAKDVSHPQTHADDDPTLPFLPERPENLLADEVTYEVEIETQEDYDDAMPGEAPANENAGISATDASAQADVIVDAAASENANIVEIEVHSPPE